MRRRPVCLVCLLLMAVLYFLDVTGFFQIRENPVSDPVKQYLKDQEKVIITGTVETYTKSEKYLSIFLKNTTLLLQSNDKNSPEQKNDLYNVQVYAGQKEQIFPGSVLTVRGKLSEIEEVRNPGGFDKQLYYACRHTYYEMEQAEILEQRVPAFSYREWLFKLRNRFEEILEKCTGSQAAYFEAMLLGDRSALSYEEKTMLQQAGLIHLFTISGLHIGLIGRGCFRILSKMGMGLWPSGFLSFGLLLFYGNLTGNGAATVRAMLMFMLEVGGRIAGRSYDSATALAFSAILLLLECPAWLYSSSFLLSFSAIIGMLWITPVLQGFADTGRKGNTPFLSALGIQSAMLPVLLFFQGEISLTGFVLNLFLLPTAGIIFVSGILSLLTGSISFAFGGGFAIPGKLVLILYERLADFSGEVPFTAWIPGSPSKTRIVFYYLFLLLFLFLLLRWRKPHGNEKGMKIRYRNWKHRKKIGTVIRISVICLAFGILALFLTVKDRKNLVITCLDVGQGDGVVLQIPHGGTIISDFGSSSENKVGRYTLLPFLKHEGIDYVDGIFLSHMDEDHISGVEALLEEITKKLTSIRIGTLFLPECVKRDKAAEHLLSLAENAGVRRIWLSAGDRLQFGRAEIHILAPSQGMKDGDKNDASLVYEIKYGDFQGLFTGDLGMEGEKLMSDLPEKVDFLKVAHHGSKYSTSESFLERVQPKIGVISCAERNLYGHPSGETVKRLEKVGCKLFYTMMDHAVVLSTDGKNVAVSCPFRCRNS